MTAVIIVFSIIFVLMLILLLPISVGVDIGDKTKFDVKYCGIKIFNNAKAPKEQENEKQQEQKAENLITAFFKNQKQEKGFLGAIKFCFSLLNIIIKKCFFIIKRIKVKKFRLNLIVATNNAAHSAIEYGAVCAVVYPPLALLEENGCLKSEKIDVLADFEHKESRFSVSFVAKSNLLILIFCFIKGFIEYKQLEREWKNERK